MVVIDFYFTNIIFEWIYNQMKRIQSFYSFINEGVFGTFVAFTFIPVDKNFKCLDADLVNSKTLPPSEGLKSGTYGYLLVPVTIETQQLLLSPYFKQTNTVKGNIDYVKGPDTDGLIVMNGGEYASGAKTGKASITAEVPGFSQNIAIYLKSGNALIAEILMKKIEGWDVDEIKNSGNKKIANGFPSNNCIMFNYWEGVESASECIKTILAASSSDIGLSINDLENIEKYDPTEDLLEFFKNNPGDFMSMNFSGGVFEKISDLAKQKEPDQNISKTIDNLSDFKSSGFFDD
jgi:hypothetical protein